MRVELPEPTPEERAHCERVAALIRNEIAAAGDSIDFARYMELALYAPGLGYYSAGAAKFGAAGDFITAPELGCVFARCFARAIAPVLRETQGDILELGPGSGALAAELLLELERFDVLPARYRLLERSADLRARQRETIAARCAHLAARCEWLDAPPGALAVRAFVLRDKGLFARQVGVDENKNFVWREVEADAPMVDAVRAAVTGSGPPSSALTALPRPYFSEVCVMLPPWLAEVTRTLRQGSAWFIDYGYADGAYYAPARREGTLRCHWRHRAHNDPLILPGLQDITAWVDFDALARAGAQVGFAVEAHATQAQFLIAHGLDEVFARTYADAPDEAARYALAQEVKRLTLPNEMGERFRVMVLRTS